MNPMEDVATPKSLSKMIEKVCVHEDAHSLDIQDMIWMMICWKSAQLAHEALFSEPLV